ncbi:hypothetical protein KZ829_02310 [Actinoplanes hulinensis]|uniref:Uncharacterized protein n=1 Tax=Actinoplanes hulinensis TaxID=1144547 RepID=A0ABS7AV21_9ACTN|nr:hypothetical protein [Actinoplanes hulinensis]MBW6432575.1 hypothetical protein [Actinoplanes hulinensis]
MNKVLRTLTMAGLGLVAGLAASAPAMAVDGGDKAPAKHSTSKVQKHYPYFGDEVVGYFRTLRGCERAGWIGEVRGYWDAYDCDLVRVGYRYGGAWALEVDRNAWNWGRPGFRDYYRGYQYRYGNDGFLGYGPRFGGWVNGPIGNSPFVAGGTY